MNYYVIEANISAVSINIARCMTIHQMLNLASARIIQQVLQDDAYGCDSQARDSDTGENKYALYYDIHYINMLLDKRLLGIYIARRKTTGRECVYNVMQGN